MTATEPRTGRANQKRRTYLAIVGAARDLIWAGSEVTMPGVAKAALVSEATAYRYFPDLASLLNEAMAGLMPDPDQALAPIAGCPDPVERVAFAAEFLLRHVAAHQNVVRAMISATITRPATAAARPGMRFGLIAAALAPLTGADPATLAQLRRDLSVVISAEALFSLTDLSGLSTEDAIASLTRTARTLTEAALRVAAPAATPPIQT
jgi:AcrR family transcriptional regulator